MEDDLLGVIAHVGDDRGAPDFRSCPCRGWHGDDRGHALGAHARVPVLAILKIPDRPILCHHQSDRLGGIDRAAAAECDYTVVPPGAVRRDAAGHVCFHGIALYLRVDLATEPGTPAGFHRGTD